MDWDKIKTLLSIADLARQWPDLKFIEDGALAELRGMRDIPKTPYPTPRAIPANVGTGGGIGIDAPELPLINRSL